VWTQFTPTEVTLPYDLMPDDAKVAITLGYPDKPAEEVTIAKVQVKPLPPDADPRAVNLRAFRAAVKKLDLKAVYESAHAQLAEQAVLVKPALPDEVPQASRAAALKLYEDAAKKLYDGFVAAMTKNLDSADAERKQVAQQWFAVSGK
jgi:hypothetical protein